MSFVSRSRLGATTPVAVAFALVLIAACGSDKKSTEAANQASSADGNATKAVTNSAYSTKMARQTTDSVQEQADFSETASTGTDDGGGVEPPEQHGRKKGFNMNMNPNMDFNNITAGFEGNITLSGSRNGGANVSGQCGIKVQPHAAGVAGAQNFTIVLVTDTTRTLDNNDTIEIKTEPNVVISRLGSRLSGTVTRTINGQVHRTLTSATDVNANFDITIAHQGHVVVDTYNAGPSFSLKDRTINGTSTVTDAKAGITSEVTFKDLKRGTPSSCFCPTGGTITQQVTQNSQTTTHTYSFGGTCGQSTVSIDGSAAVSATAKANGQDDAVSQNSNAQASATATASAAVHGSLTWEHCVPTAADTAN